MKSSMNLIWRKYSGFACCVVMFTFEMLCVLVVKETTKRKAESSLVYGQILESAQITFRKAPIL